MVGIAQLVRAPDCGSGCRGFESLYPPHIQGVRAGASAPALPFSTWGCSQVVRQGTLTPSLAGSSPAIPATSPSAPQAPGRPPWGAAQNFISDPVAQSAEHLPFKQGVRSSNLRWVTKSPQALCCLRRFFVFGSMYTFHHISKEKTPQSIGITSFLPCADGKEALPADHVPPNRSPASAGSIWKPCSILVDREIFL